MNRFLRTAYSTTYVYFYLTLLAVTVTGKDLPFPAFLCLFFGLLTALLPDIYDSLSRLKGVFAALGGLLALLGFLPILLAQVGLLQYLAYGLGLLAGILFFFLRQEPVSHSFFMESFRRTLIIAAAVLVFILFALMPTLSNGKTFSFGAEELKTVFFNLIPLIIMLLAVGVLHLRGLRSEKSGMDRKAFRRRQLRDLIVFAAAVTLVYVFNPLGYLVRGIVYIFKYGIVRLLQPLIDLIPFGEHPPIPDESFPPGIAEVVTLSPEEAPPPGDPSPAVTGNTLRVIVFIFVLVGLAGLVMLIVILVKKRRGRGKKYQGYPHETVEAMEEEEEREEEPVPKKRSADPRLRIRYQYRSFMKYLKNVPVDVEKTDTSGEIGEAAKEGIRAEAEPMDTVTGIYNRARYQQKEAPTAADAEEMKRLLEGIRH